MNVWQLVSTVGGKLCTFRSCILGNFTFSTVVGVDDCVLQYTELNSCFTVF